MLLLHLPWWGVEFFSNMLGTLNSVTTPVLKPSSYTVKVGKFVELGKSKQLFTDVDASTNFVTEYEGVKLTGSLPGTNKFLLMGV